MIIHCDIARLEQNHANAISLSTTRHQLIVSIYCSVGLFPQFSFPLRPTSSF